MESAYFGMVLSLVAFWVGLKVKARLRTPLLPPVLVATVLVIAVLLLLDIPYDTYAAGIEPLTWLLTPATVCLAVPLYRQLALLRRHWAAILVSVAAGCLACAVALLVCAKALGMSPELYHSLQPKSVTNAIALGISETLGGVTGITSLAVTASALLAVGLGNSLFRLLRITHPIAKGLALGNATHALGTAAAMELGEVEGAMSSLTIVVAGVMTVLLAPVFAGLL